MIKVTLITKYVAQVRLPEKLHSLRKNRKNLSDLEVKTTLKTQIIC